ELLVVEAARRLRQLDRALEEPAIHVVSDEALTETLERSLRERRLLRVEDPQHHLPAGVDHRQLDGLRVRRARVRLKQHRHGQLRRRDGLLALVRAAVHPGQLVLEGVVEEIEPMLAKEREELLGPPEPLEEHLLAPT